MDLARLRAALPPGLPQPVLLEETDSTNRVAKELSAAGAPHGTLTVAARQSAGRGRRGRSFFSPEGGIYMSLLLRPDCPPEEVQLVTPMAAVAVSRTVDRLCGASTRIKWVNDILLDGKKLCGILTERCPDGGVVVGIGLNHRAPENGFPPELASIACALYPGKGEAAVSPEALCAGITAQLMAMAPRLTRRDYLTEYRHKSCLLGKTVTVYPVSGAPYPALAVDFDECAHLLVRNEDGQLAALSSGEVSVRTE